MESSILIAGNEVEEGLAHDEHITNACRINESANEPTAHAERTAETESDRPMHTHRWGPDAIR